MVTVSREAGIPVAVPGALIPAMGKISNRSVLKRLAAWNCPVIKVQGDWTTVDVRGHAVKVRSAHVSTGNSTETFRELLDRMGMTWPEFIGAPVGPEALRASVSMTRQEQGKPTAANTAPPEFWLSELHQEALRMNAELTKTREPRHPKPEPQTEQELQETLTGPIPAEKEPEVMTDATVHPMHRGPGRPPKGVVPMTTKVLEYLIKEARPVASHEIASALNLTQNQANGAGAGLVKAGAARRVKQSVYQAADSTMQHVRLHQETREQVEHVVAAVAATRAVDEPMDEDVINDVLDLLFPNGFKARHLARIDSWREETKRLIQEVQQ